MEQQEEKKSSVRTIRKLLKNAESTVQAGITKTTPVLMKTLDKSMRKAASALTDALNTVDKKSAEDQIELLKLHRKFLEKQTAVIDDRVESLLKKRGQALLVQYTRPEEQPS
ncbi:MAG: hypothetical protein JRM80_06890 [Nitrososphaerota archaeon]|nr:hypothetical protein [Nitrososphaerota archaeon]